MNHSSKYFKNPESFRPERWLNDPEYDSDQQDVFHPFQFGPRSCPGQKSVLSPSYHLVSVSSSSLQSLLALHATNKPLLMLCEQPGID